MTQILGRLAEVIGSNGEHLPGANLFDSSAEACLGAQPFSKDPPPAPVGGARGMAALLQKKKKLTTTQMGPCRLLAIPQRGNLVPADPELLFSVGWWSNVAGYLRQLE